MKDVVVVLDGDESNSLTSNPRGNKHWPEVLTLLSEEGTQEEVGRKDYPSSPRQVEIVPDTSVQCTENSDEICAPFYHDINATGEQDTHHSIEEIDVSYSSRGVRKRMLSDDLSEQAPRFPELSSLGEGDSSRELTNKRRNLSRHTSPLGRSFAHDALKETGWDEANGSRKEEVALVDRDVLKSFPTSSPTTDRLRSGSFRNRSLRLFVQDSDDSTTKYANLSRAPNGDMGEPARTHVSLEGLTHLHEEARNVPLLPLLSARNHIKRANEQTSSSNAKPSKFSTSGGEELASQQAKHGANDKPKVLELELEKFLLDEEDSHISFSSDFLPSLRQPIPFSESREEETVPSKQKELENYSTASQIVKVTPYIVHGRCFDDDESGRLIKTWLKNDKRAFKESNMIPRSNEKARGSLKVDMPARLLENLKKACKGDLESNVAPGILQPCADALLPRIRFLRACQSEYDFKHDVYYPCEPLTLEESLTLLYYDARDFFEQYRTDKEFLLKNMRAISKAGKYLIIVLCDLNKLEKSLDALENRRFQEKIQNQLTGSQNNATSKTKKSKLLEELSMQKFDIEQRLRLIDRLWGVKIHTVSSHSEFAESLPNLVSVIGKQRMDPAIRYMRYSHISGRSCKNKTDVLRQTLHQVNRMPELKANSVVSAYPTFQTLFKDFKKGELKSGLDGKHLMTEAMEERLFKLFTCENPSESI